MAQIATIKQHPPTAAVADRAVDAAPDLAPKGQGTTLRLVQKTASTTPKELAGGRAAASLRRFADLPARTASDMIQAGGALARFWLEQANQQVARNAQTLRKLAAARGWRERLEIQSAFVSGSLAWLNEGMARYAEVTGAMVARSREARAGAPAATANSR
jgi:hypothetical protein